jgi:nucleoid-associated protein YgaU
MKPTKTETGPALAAALFALAVIAGCAGVNKALTKADQAVTQAADAVDTAAGTVDKAAATAVRAANTVDKAAGTLEDARDRLASRAAVVDNLPRYIRHRVVRGDTLWGVSKANYRTGFLWPMVCEQNGIANCNRIEVGDVIRVLPDAQVKALPKADIDRWRQQAYEARP